MIQKGTTFFLNMVADFHGLGKKEWITQTPHVWEVSFKFCFFRNPINGQFRSSIPDCWEFFNLTKSHGKTEGEGDPLNLLESWQPRGTPLQGHPLLRDYSLSWGLIRDLISWGGGGFPLDSHDFSGIPSHPAMRCTNMNEAWLIFGSP